MEKGDPISSKPMGQVDESKSKHPDTMDSETTKPLVVDQKDADQSNPKREESAASKDVPSKPISKRENQARIVSASNVDGEPAVVDSAAVSLSMASSEVSIDGTKF